MHYIGMAAMRLPAMHHYDDDVVIGSVVIAWVVSLVALGLIKMNLVLDPANGGPPECRRKYPRKSRARCSRQSLP